MNAIARFSVRTLALCFALSMPVLGQDDAYNEGQAALRQQDFARAAEAFERAREQGEKPDASSYWHAYSLYRAGRARPAMAAARAMLRRYPESRWSDDARALVAELDAGAVDSGAEEELRLLALYHLMEANPERGMALLRKMLESTDSAETKRHLLFLMAGQGGDEISREILELARGESDPGLQIQAIHIIAASGSHEAIELLGELYRSDADPGVRRAIIDAHIAADAADRLAGIVRAEPDPALKRHGIMALGAMEATDALRGLYPTVSDPSLRRALLEAFAISGDVSELADIIDNERDPQVRAVAIRSLGIAGDERSGAMLKRLAASSDDPAEQRAILEAVMMMDEGQEAALEIARRTSDPGVLRQAVHTLGALGAGEDVLAIYEQLDTTNPQVQMAVLDALAMSGEGVQIAVRIARDSSDPAVVSRAIHTLAMLDASDELRALYGTLEDESLRRITLQQLALTQDSDVLLEILETETSPAIRADAIRALSMNRDMDGDGLAALYPAAGRVEKYAIIDALLVQHADEALAALLENESDPGLKRRLLQALMATGSDYAEEYLIQWLEKAR